MSGRNCLYAAGLGALLIALTFASGCIEKRSFQPVIPPPPSVPAARLPQNNAYLGSVHSPRPGALQPRFAWTAATTDEDGPLTYKLELAANRDFSGEVFEYTTEDTSFAPPAPLPVSTVPPVGRRYFWRVRACLPLICSEPSAVRWINLGRSDHDYNGDGYADVLVGAPKNSQGGQDSGKAYVYFGGAGTTIDTVPDGVLAPSTTGDRFGDALDTAGDFDGDGFADVLVGAPKDEGKGRVFLFFGGAGRAFDATADLIFQDSSLDQRFGSSVSSAGDFNGDGFSDFVIGAPGVLTDLSPGGVAIYFGNGERAKPSGVRLTVKTGPNHVGDQVALLGDLNNDGLSDLSVADASIIPNQTPCSSSLYLGRTDLKPGQAPDDQLSANIGGCKLAIKAAGDVNNDGFSDLLKAIGESGIGDFTGASAALLLGSELPKYPTGEVPLGLGVFSIAALKDITGDGFDDFAVARATTSILVDIYAGAARIESPLRPLLSYNGPQGRFAYSITGAGDVNGDGLGDLAVGDPGLNSDQGAVSMYFGVVGAFDVGVDGLLDAAFPQSSFGLAVASLWPTCARRRAARI